MAYRRSPRCTYCYNVGHTRRSCPSVKQQAIAGAAKPASERSYGESRAIEAVKHYSTIERACSYCTLSGHNVKGCNIRKSDIRNAAQTLVEWRKSLLVAIASTGCGIGAVIRHKDWISGIGYPSPNGSFHYEIITSIKPEHAVYWYMDMDGRIPSLFATRQINRFDGAESSVATPTVLRTKLLALQEKEFVREYSSYGAVDVECPSFNAEFGLSGFTDYHKCLSFVENYFNERYGGRGKKMRTRSDIIYSKVIKE
jgi:hypothetical protein